MAVERTFIEVADVSDLAALVDEVRRSQRPTVLRQHGEDVAILSPARGTRRGTRRSSPLRGPTEAEVARSRAGILAAAGAWKDIDTETLKAELRRQRDVNTRPPVDL